MTISNLSKISTVFKTEMRENLPLLGVFLLYIASCTFINFQNEHFKVSSLKGYYSILNSYLPSFSFLFFSIKIINYLTKNIQIGFSALKLNKKVIFDNYLNFRFAMRFSIVYFSIPPFMYCYSSYKQNFPKIFPFSSDIALHKLDYLLHFNNIPWQLLQSIIGFPRMTLILDFLYHIWGSIFIYTLLYITCSRNSLLRIHFILSVCTCWIIIGNVLASLFSSVGPCYFAQVVGFEKNPYAEMLEYLHSIPRLTAVKGQEYLWNVYINDVSSPFGGISAMPSMHVSIAVLLSLVYWRINTWLGAVFTFYAAIIFIGSIHLGWHYAIDGYFSAFITVLIWKGIEKLLPYISREPKILNES